MRTTILLLFIITGLTLSQNSTAQSSGCNVTASFNHIDTNSCESYFHISQNNPSNDYFWDFGDGNTSNMHYAYHQYANPGTYNVTLIVSNDTCADTLTQTITIDPCPAPCNINASFTYNDSACYTGFMPTVNDSTLTYWWDFGDGNSSSDYQPEHLYSNSGQYTVTLMIYDGLCSDTVTQLINAKVCNSPCNLDAEFTYYDTTYCYTAFSATHYQWNDNNDYWWDFGDGNTSNYANASNLYANPGTYNVTLIVSNDTCADTLTQTITIDPCPAPCNINASFTYNDSACYTGFMPTVNDSTLTYWWDFGDGNSSSDYQPEHLYSNSGQYTVTLMIYDGLCSDTVTQLINAQACPAPCPIDANFSYVNTNGNTFNFSPDAFDASYNYHWIFGDGTTSTDPNATHTYADEDDYFVTLVVSDCNCSASETLVVTVADSNNCGYNGDFTYQVENDGSYTFTPVYQSPNYGYYWTFGDGSSAYNMLPNYSYGTNGNFTVSLNIWEPGNGACSDTTYQNIQVNDSSACQLNSSFTTSTDTSNNVIHFYPDIYNPNHDYFWDFGDGQTSTFHSPNHSYSSNGMYTVTLTVNFDSCQSVDTTYIPMLSANLVNNEGSNSEVNIYPNPTSDFLTIDFNTLNSEKIQISLIDMNGKLIKQEFFTPNKGKNHKQINVQTISQGMYQLVLREKNGTFIHRVRFVKN